ncbi:hypothetical protein [Peribacillus sp. SCS-155]
MKEDNLREVEQKFQSNKNPVKDLTKEGRHPDQQHRLKDQENLRK